MYGIVVKHDPSNTEVLRTLSPTRNIASGQSLPNPPYPVQTTQPTAGAAGAYRGDLPPHNPVNTILGPTTAIPAPGAGASIALDLSGKPSGKYTVTISRQSMVKTGSAACVIGYPTATGLAANPNPNGVQTFGNTFTQALLPDEVLTFEYRPWEETFKDVLGNGQVQFNIQSAAESIQRLGTTDGAVVAGGVVGFAIPDTSTFALPADPAACTADPNLCLPPGAVLCSGQPGCVPRIVLISRSGGGEALNGVFDRETRAFIAHGQIGDNPQRLLFSLGTENDAYYRALLAQLGPAAAAQGVDLQSILATTIRLRSGTSEVKLSLLNGLQIDPTTAPSGIQILNAPTVQAGVLLNISIGTAPISATRPCVAGVGQTLAGDSDPATAAPDTFTPTNGIGMKVERTDYLPVVPKVGPVGAIVGGPIYHITGNFPADGGVADTSTAIVGLDTAPDQPQGYPVWIAPVAGVNAAAPRLMDFIGTATWSASQTNILFGCLHIGFMLGTGIQINNNPLPFGFGNVPIWTSDALFAAIMSPINAQIQAAVDQAAGNPQVSGVLDQVLAAAGL